MSVQWIAAALVALTMWPLVAQSNAEVQLRHLYDEHRWFELRDRVEVPTAPPFYRCAVASAFNRVDEAERCFRQVILGSTETWNAQEAREQLGTLYLRVGRAAEALRLFEELSVLAPQRQDLQNVKSLLTAVMPARNQRVRSSAPKQFGCSVGQGSVRLPISINGRAPVHWFLDTGFTMPALSQREADMLGLIVRDQGGRAVDGAGGSTTVRVTRADRVVIGRTEVRDVPMLVFPDSQPPWKDLLPGQGGIIGLPLALAVERIRWTSQGSCETGPVRAPTSSPAAVNIALNGLEPMVRVGFADRTLEFHLDTGNQIMSQLWESFARDFPTLLADRGTAGTVRVNQIGGSNEREVIVLPEIRLNVGGRATLLKPANVFSRPVGDERLHGNLGMDLLGQAAEVIIDFRSMTLTLH
jgi:predicted aspartyl protease